MVYYEPTPAPGYNKCVIYSVLLFYTLGVFVVGYLIGGQAFDPSEQAKFEAKHWETQATHWKKETRMWKQQYNALSNTPAGMPVPCPICQDCPICPICDPDAASNQLKAATGGNCPPPSTDDCPACECKNGEDHKPRAHLPTGAAPSGNFGDAHHADCDKQGLLEAVDEAQKISEASVPPEQKKGKKPVVDAKHLTKQVTYGAMKRCLQIAMPAVAEAYEESLAARGKRGKR